MKKTEIYIESSNKKIAECADRILKRTNISEANYSEKSIMHLGFSEGKPKCNLFIRDVINCAFGGQAPDRIDGKTPLRSTQIWQGKLSPYCRKVADPQSGDLWAIEPVETKSGVWMGHLGVVKSTIEIWSLGYITGISARSVKGVDEHFVGIRWREKSWSYLRGNVEELRFYRCDRVPRARKRQ